MSIGAIAFLSDVEGSEKKLRDFLARHPAFDQGRLARDTMFVHGGDVPDRFPGGIYVVDELLRQKEAAPERVVLIAGNRDVNKIRLTAELSPEGLSTRPPRKDDEYPGWLSGRPDDRSRRLRFILEKTMGAPVAFEMRRRDLVAIGRPADDEAVVDSFLEDLRPGARFASLLRRSRLLHRVGNTLFCHAGITGEGLGYVPGQPRATDLEDWIERLDRWYQGQLDEWEQGAWSGSGPRPGEELIQYCEPDAGGLSNPQSVVYCRNVDKYSKISLPSPAACRFLLDAGIERLAIGHTPSGQAPVILRREDDRFEVLLADNSHGVEAETSSLITIARDQRSVRIDSFVPLGDSRQPIAFETALGVPTPVGKRLTDGSIILAPTREGYITYQMLPGWKVEYRERSAGEIARLRVSESSGADPGIPGR